MERSDRRMFVSRYRPMEGAFGRAERCSVLNFLEEKARGSKCVSVRQSIE